jgi:chromosomal replication initiator protein
MPESAAGLWDQCLQSIKGRIQSQSFDTWFGQTSIKKLGPKEVVVEVPSRFFADWLEEHYTWLISGTIKDEFGWTPSLTFSIRDGASGEFPVKTSEKPTEHSSSQPAPSSSSAISRDPAPDFRYRFDQFVVGESNGFSYSAAQAVAESPGKTAYNPLVIYGGVGLGKTHLLQAIGDYCLRNNTAEHVVYVNAERFVSDYITAIRKNDVTAFVSRYRTADVLLVDDIQFYVQTEACQREFLNTFNTLHQAGKQIVISSDRPPASLKGFEDRLISRFQWGLVTDIAAPDLETRIAILTQKAEERNITLPPDVARYVAECVTANVRELEGALTRLVAIATFKREPLTAELAETALTGIGQTTSAPESITIEDIQKNTARFFDVPLESLVGATRKQKVAIARHVSMYLCKAITGAPLKAIGNQFGKRDHTTVIHACRNIDQRIESDPGFQTAVKKLRGQIQGTQII